MVVATVDGALAAGSVVVVAAVVAVVDAAVVTPAAVMAVTSVSGMDFWSPMT